MLIGFPHMGNAYITAKAALDDMGAPYVIPPDNSLKTLELGARHVPEGACLPLKITIGNLIEAHRMGADTQLMVGAWGPCRFGYYCQMQREVLQDAGCAMDAIHLEVCRAGAGELIRRIRKLTGGLNPPKLAGILNRAAKLSLAVDELERLSRHVMAWEAHRGASETIWQGYRRAARATVGTREMLRMTAETGRKLNEVPLDESRLVLRVGIVGEIYGTIDPWTNMRLEARLASMGVQTERYVTIGHWVNDTMNKGLHKRRDLRFAEAAAGYLGTDIGGHTRETLGHTVMHARQGYDGVIQLYPLGCMPEIVAQAILPAISRDYDLPVLTLVIDEMTGEAGYVTRIEAFVDLLRQRRQRKEGERTQ